MDENELIEKQRQDSSDQEESESIEVTVIKRTIQNLKTSLDNSQSMVIETTIKLKNSIQAVERYESEIKLLEESLSEITGEKHE